ncbi:hypothetical protein M0R45_018837 [Rubus argutus]|uniref:Orn/Lys/Arg decarboxylases family 1 pyridoxal-P attachment site domain-containing protein n=1 Tax=Rubus argutus TaxID=59490 RepID=A0AAW1X3M1_RUBAR
MLLPHLPGHDRGQAAPNSIIDFIGLKPFLHDLPELPELDNLFFSRRAHFRCTTGCHTLWLIVGGTTCGIQAAIMATCSPGEILILPRNSYLSAVSALILSGAVPSTLSLIIILTGTLLSGTLHHRHSQIHNSVKALQLAIEAKNMLRKISGILVLDVPSFPKFFAIDPLWLTIGFQQLGLVMKLMKSYKQGAVIAGASDSRLSSIVFCNK